MRTHLSNMHQRVIPTGWKMIQHTTASGNALERQFNFKCFNEAFGFISRVGLEAERRNHHPDWRNVYHQVWVQWSTHDKGNQVTQIDHDMATFCNIVADQIFSKDNESNK